MVYIVTKYDKHRIKLPILVTFLLCFHWLIAIFCLSLLLDLKHAFLTDDNSTLSLPLSLLNRSLVTL